MVFVGIEFLDFDIYIIVYFRLYIWWVSNLIRLFDKIKGIFVDEIKFMYFKIRLFGIVWVG